jgi:hypothetical protein
MTRNPEMTPAPSDTDFSRPEARLRRHRMLAPGRSRFAASQRQAT